MGRRSGLGRTVRAGLAVGGRISKLMHNRSGGRRTAADPFSTQPSGPRRNPKDLGDGTLARKDHILRGSSTRPRARRRPRNGAVLLLNLTS
jgi:hypothetical protein